MLISNFTTKRNSVFLLSIHSILIFTDAPCNGSSQISLSEFCRLQDSTPRVPLRIHGFRVSPIVAFSDLGCRGFSVPKTALRVAPSPLETIRRMEFVSITRGRRATRKCIRPLRHSPFRPASSLPAASSCPPPVRCTCRYPRSLDPPQTHKFSPSASPPSVCHYPVGAPRK